MRTPSLTTFVNTGIMSVFITAMSGPAAAQGPVDRIAYDQCGPDLGTWDVGCNVFTLVNGSHTLVASGGVGPRWSPDGSKIVFTGSGIEFATSPASLDEILVANLADGSVANLTNHPARDGSPACLSRATQMMRFFDYWIIRKRLLVFEKFARPTSRQLNPQRSRPPQNQSFKQ